MSWSSTWMARTKPIGPCSSAFLVALARNWVGSGAVGSVTAVTLIWDGSCLTYFTTVPVLRKSWIALNCEVHLNRTVSIYVCVYTHGSTYTNIYIVMTLMIRTFRLLGNWGNSLSWKWSFKCLRTVTTQSFSVAEKGCRDTQNSYFRVIKSA